MCRIFSAVKDADQFPLVAMYGDCRWKPIGNRRVVGEILEHVFAGQFAALECGEETCAVEGLLLCGCQSKAFE